MSDDLFTKFSSPPPIKRRFVLRIDYPASPAEILWNAMEYVVDESFANKVSKEYMGEIRLEGTDENGMQLRKYGRIVMREIKSGIRLV